MAAGASAGEGIHLEVVTRHGVALRVDTDEAQAPSVHGEFGVLPGHVPLLAALKSGVLTYRDQGVQKRVVIGPGFAEVGPDKLLVLTEHFVPEDDIDPAATEETLEAARDRLAELTEQGVTTGARVAEQTARVEWCEAQLALVEQWRPGHRSGTKGGEAH